jgi:hypothetical protein
MTVTIMPMTAAIARYLLGVINIIKLPATEYAGIPSGWPGHLDHLHALPLGVCNTPHILENHAATHRTPLARAPHHLTEIHVISRVV